MELSYYGKKFSLFGTKKVISIQTLIFNAETEKVEKEAVNIENQVMRMKNISNIGI